MEEWELEPNEMNGTIDGYRVQILRNLSLGILCGYVFLDKNHPEYGDDFSEINVHGGVTFTGEEDGFWKVGFDCGHSNDFMPLMPSFRFLPDPSSSYRNFQYVFSELKSLVSQLKSLASGEGNDV